MSLVTRINDLATAFGTDVKQLKTWLTGSSSGNLTGLNTTDKSSIIGAINELKATGGATNVSAASETVAGIVELATLAEVATGTDATRAVTAAGVRQERQALKDEILGGASAAYDTLLELQNAFSGENDAITALTATVGGKADKTEIYTRTEIGDPETDLVAVYTAAKA